MTRDELYTIYLVGEELEYHVTGAEIDPHKLMPAPGWYPCFIDDMDKATGDIEIALYPPARPDGLWITVLSKNIPIAFRTKQPVNA